MGYDGLCLHCKERKAVLLRPEYSRPVPEPFVVNGAVVLCEPCQETADTWFTMDEYLSYFPSLVMVPIEEGAA